MISPPHASGCEVVTAVAPSRQVTNQCASLANDLRRRFVLAFVLARQRSGGQEQDEQGQDETAGPGWHGAVLLRLSPERGDVRAVYPSGRTRGDRRSEGVSLSCSLLVAPWQCCAASGFAVFWIPLPASSAAPGLLS